MSRTAAAICLALGFALAGWFVGHGFERGRAADRYVTVKGLSEREVGADVALWNLRTTAADNSLEKAQGRIQSSIEAIRGFLEKHGVPAGDTRLTGLEVTDALANPWRQGGPVDFRYVVTQGILVRSDHPDVLFEASQHVGDLVQAGVVLAGGGGPGGGPTFLFTTLNDLKPAMIAEATASARAAAEKFAKDSGSTLGGIRQANQGVFVILPRDQIPGAQEESQMQKTVRVVTTVEYYLKD